MTNSRPTLRTARSGKWLFAKALYHMESCGGVYVPRSSAMIGGPAVNGVPLSGPPAPALVLKYTTMPSSHGQLISLSVLPQAEERKFYLATGRARRSSIARPDIHWRRSSLLILSDDDDPPS
ncbi:unnamed protein product [Cyclocybe aegerita]|uniref:Uncharacterized protein n=1 Tax=Cyclocybe aegerita TaxID=1973307 RepID=A0A8S0WV99_CYCAE|nr:unnamed protein product [Cyclocybe aegerita]